MAGHASGQGFSAESLDELVEHYSGLLPIEKRVDISHLLWDKNSTGDDLLTFVKKMGITMLKFPWVGSLVATLAATNLLDYFNAMPQASDEQGILLAYTYFGTLAAMSMMKQYGLKDGSRVKPRRYKEANLLEKLRCGLLNNPHIAGFASGTALSALALQAGKIVNDAQGFYTTEQLINAGVWAVPILGYVAGYAIMSMAKSNELVKNGFEQQKKRELKADTLGAKLKVVYNWPFEHPGTISSAVAASYFTFSMAKNFESILPGMIPAAAAWHGFEASLYGLAAYFGVSAASWVLHSNSLQLMKDYAMLGINSAFGRTEEAIGCQKSIMEIPTTEGNECKNHFRLGNLYMKNEKIEEALTEYYRGIELIDKRDRFYSNPLDAVGGMIESSGIPELISIVESAAGKFSEAGEGLLEDMEKRIKEGEQVSAGFAEKMYGFFQRNVKRDGLSRLKRFAGEVSHRELGDADRNMRRIICADIMNPELHLLYAKFLDTLGDSELAEKEYRLTTSILLSNPEIAGNFERIGVSRNEVMTYNASKFLNKTLVFKRSKKREDIELEYAALSIFYSELKDKVAKPLALIEHGGMSYLIMEHSGKKTLQDLAAEGRLTYDILSEGIELLCKIQEVGERHGADA